MYIQPLECLWAHSLGVQFVFPMDCLNTNLWVLSAWKYLILVVWAGARGLGWFIKTVGKLVGPAGVWFVNPMGLFWVSNLMGLLV